MCTVTLVPHSLLHILLQLSNVHCHCTPTRSSRGKARFLARQRDAQVDVLLEHKDGKDENQNIPHIELVLAQNPPDPRLEERQEGVFEREDLVL